MENIESVKSKKGLYIGGAIVAIVLIALIARGGMSKKVGDLDVDRNKDGSATYSNEDGTVTVGGNQWPENWPSDAPKYKNATVQYSGSSNPQTGEKGSAVAFTTSDSAKDVMEFYKKELASNGWTVEQSATMGASTVVTARKDNRNLGVYIADSGNGQVSVTMSIATPDSQ